MPNDSDLPYLVALLEDENPVVEEALKTEIAGFGDDFEPALRRAGIELQAGQRRRLESLRPPAEPTGAFRSAWDRWRSGAAAETGDRALEAGFGLVSWLLRADADAGQQIAIRLEAETGRCLAQIGGREPSPSRLATVLFGAGGLSGESEDYYASANSDLLAVLEQRRGNPISLACVYRLVGGRLGLPIGACNFPGHFMARADFEGEPHLVDCFNGGRFFSVRSVRAKVGSGADYLDEEPPASTVIRRVLLNLAHAFGRGGAAARSARFAAMAESL